MYIWAEQVKGAEKGSTLNQYKQYFYKRIWEDEMFKKNVLSLQGKRLGCFCHSDDTCHVGIIIEYLNKI